MKVSMSFGKDYESKYEWENCSCQGGSSGIVLPKNSFSKVFNGDPLKGLAEGMASEESYMTAFFEAFPTEPKCFIRGEGKNIKEAEEEAWNKYQKIITCEHEMERRTRTDGYGYCKHCSYSSMVFEPLTKCCKCKKPTAYTKDYKGKWYCKKHSYTMPKNPNPSRWEKMHNMDNKLPRKRKKLLKKCAKNRFEQNGIYGKIRFNYKVYMKFNCKGKEFHLLFKRQELELIKKFK